MARGSKRTGLQETGVGRGDTIPPQRVQIGGEVLGRVEPALGNPRPLLTRQDSGIQLSLPEYFQLLALRIVFYAREFYERRIFLSWSRDETLHQVESLADSDDLANFWNLGSRKGFSQVYPLVRLTPIPFFPLPDLVVITRAPLAALDPYKEEAAAPFRTLTDSISAGLSSPMELP